jgi:hypothetical protein
MECMVDPWVCTKTHTHTHNDNATEKLVSEREMDVTYVLSATDTESAILLYGE